MNLSCDKLPEADSDHSADPMRRRILKGTIAAAVLLKMLSVESLVSEVFADENETVAKTDSGEILTDEQRIEKTEEDFLKFKQKILSRLDNFVKDPEMKAKIQRVFEIFDENRKNPWRKKLSLNEVPCGEEKKGWFSYRFFNDMRPYYVGFNGLYRAIRLNRNFFNSADLGWVVTLCHELVHVEQDDKYRKNIPRERYRNFWNSGEHLAVVTEDEAEAISIAVEILNVAMDGAPKRDILKTGWANIPAEHDDVRNFLTRMAIAYYTRDYSSFTSYVEERYRKIPGEETFFTRELIPIQPE